MPSSGQSPPEQKQKSLSAFDLSPGEKVTRVDLNERFGGGIQGGMLTPKGGMLMFLFSDPKSGEALDYTTDGWADSNRTRYSFTGEGAIGSQSIARGKNKILFETLSTKREVHLFYAVGTKPGLQTRIHEYLGKFKLDASAPWHPVESLDQNRETRTVVVFNLVRHNGSYLSGSATQIEADTAPSTTEIQEVEREAASDKLTFERSAVDVAKTERRERALEDNLIDWLQKNGQQAERLRIQPAGEMYPLFTNTWVPSTRELFEVKSDSTRNDIRMAAAQLLDYKRHIKPAPDTCTIVVPITPSADLVGYVESLDLEVAVFDENGLTRLVDASTQEKGNERRARDDLEMITIFRQLVSEYLELIETVGEVKETAGGRDQTAQNRIALSTRLMLERKFVAKTDRNTYIPRVINALIRQLKTKPDAAWLKHRRAEYDQIISGEATGVSANFNHVELGFENMRQVIAYGKLMHSDRDKYVSAEVLEGQNFQLLARQTKVLAELLAELRDYIDHGIDRGTIPNVCESLRDTWFEIHNEPEVFGLGERLKDTEIHALNDDGSKPLPGGSRVRTVLRVIPQFDRVNLTDPNDGNS